MKKKSGIYLDILSHILLVGATIVAIFPLIWIIISSVKGKGELTQFPTRFWPEQFTYDYSHCNYYLGNGCLWDCSILSKARSNHV